MQQARHLHNRAAVCGNLASFPVHWDDVLNRILTITEASKRTAALPHGGEALAHLVRFEFRLKDTDLSRHLKHMRLRARVVLGLGRELIDRGHPAFCRAAGATLQPSVRRSSSFRRAYSFATRGLAPPATSTESSHHRYSGTLW